MSFFLLLLFSFPLAFVAFIYESYPRFINRKFGVDIWTHLLYLQEYYKQKEIPKNIENGFLIKGIYDYPPAFIFILSKFSYPLVEKYEFLFSPFFDAMHLTIIFFASFYLTGNLYIAFLAQALYVLTPIIILENASATPRSLGYTLFTIVFMSLFFYSVYSNILFLPIAFIAGTFIFISHRFTTQGYLFFSLFFTIITKDLLYISVFIFTFLIAIVLTKGFYIKVLRGHIGNLKFWYKNIDVRFAHQVKGNYKEHKTKDFVFRVYNEFLKFPPFVLAITNPWTLPVLFVAIVFQVPFLQLRSMNDYIGMWVLFSYVLALLTIWVPKLRFLGEGQRYLELSAFPTAFLSASILLGTNGVLKSIFVVVYILMGIGAFLTVVVVQRKAIIKDTLRSLTPAMQQMFRYLKNLQDKPKLLCIPHQITTNTIYHTGCQVLVNADYTNIEKISDIYPYIKKPISDIMRKYNLNMILLNQDYAQISDLKIARYRIIKQYDNFILIQVIKTDNRTNR